MLWLTPAILATAAAGVFAMLHRDTWEASQALIVRNEVSVGEKVLGKFNYPEEMKTVQETILELLKSRSVLEAALREVGPSADNANAAAWPTDLDVAALRDSLKLAAPKGAEFGKTEVFYLNVRERDLARSIALNGAILKQLQIRSQELRDRKAQSMIAELLKTVQVAKAELDTATASLAATETGLGSDLAELRSMQDVASSDSALRRSIEEIRSQIRENATAEKANEELLTVLQAAQDDPNSLVATSSRMVESQPSLRRLKEGLVDAQLRTAELLGTMSAEHPRVIAARETEEEIGRHLHNELAAAIRGVKLELRLNAERSTLLNEQLVKTTERLDSLAKVRAAYANEAAEVKSRSALLERAEQNLSEVRASQASAAASSLISPMDAPDAGIRPIGPTRAMIVLAGALGGLLTGFGLLFLCGPAGSTQAVETAEPSRHAVHRRWNDCRLSLDESLQKLSGGQAG
jgi:uncharacterized protein involved in exopolysaccharide biosynthesis